ncbi:MAG: helix-turn-helix transcriptional regulator [Spirochaetia bacterium]|nr:helix-turn-helix transcriptional regulator [Spirochaetia bacterium]
MNGNEVRQILAKNIKRLRENRSISQEELAFTAGISIPFLSDIERGNKWPSPETVAKIATALEIDVFELFCPHLMTGTDTSIFISKLVKEISISPNNALKNLCKKYSIKLQ